MNKAFVREPEADGHAYCPRCGTVGIRVAQGPLDTHIRADCRGKIADAGWYCAFTRCEVAYFDGFERFVVLDELHQHPYPFDLDAPICACFGLTYDDVESDAREGFPTRVRTLLAKSKTSEARCGILAADGQCCMREVQRLYLKLTSPTNGS